MTASTELQTWLNGVVGGGPESDGRYPLTYADGLTYLVYCPAAQALNPALAEQPIEVFSNTAANAAATATVEAAEAEQASIDAQTHAANALTYRNAAQGFSSTASNAAIDASLSATASQESADAAQLSVSDAVGFANQAGDSADAAAASATDAANSAATVNPTNYYTKTVADGRYRLVSVNLTTADIVSGTFDVARIPALAISKTTGLQAALDGKALTGANASFVDVTAHRGDGTGVIFFNASATRYLYFNGTAYHMPAAELIVNGNQVHHAGNFNPATKQAARTSIDPIASALVNGDWNQCVDTGWYMGAGGTNGPAELGGNWLIGNVHQHNSLWITQEVWQFTVDAAAQIKYRRQKVNNVWGAWTGRVFANAHFNSPTTAVVLGCAVGGTVYLRANGVDNSTGEATLSSAGRLNCTELAIGGGTTSYFFKPATGDMGLMGDFRVRGTTYSLWANAAGWVRNPRIFVGGSDPGATAADGDIWIP